VFAFHKTESLHEWLKWPETLRARLQAMPPLLETSIRNCQIDVIREL
jgi:type I restriction enzyme R subunit